MSRQRLADSDLASQARAWKLWAVCNELTAGYSKSADRVHVVTLANMAGMRDDKASAMLREFDRLGVFIWRKDTGTRRKGFLALPSWSEPDATPKPIDPKCWSCGARSLRPYIYMGEDTGTLKCSACGAHNEPPTT